MIVTYKNLKDYSYPFYVLPSWDWHETDGVLFLEGKVLDETNMPGKTLGVRRIQSDRKDILPLKRVVLEFTELLKCNKKYFIDKYGKPFIYEKTYSSKLICYKIDRIEKKEVASLLWVHGVTHPFTLARPPLNNPKWVRLLHVGDVPWKVYDYVQKPVKATYRRV